jgi:hypothetical protein
MLSLPVLLLVLLRRQLQPLLLLLLLLPLPTCTNNGTVNIIAVSCSVYARQNYSCT